MRKTVRMGACEGGAGPQPSSPPTLQQVPEAPPPSPPGSWGTSSLPCSWGLNPPPLQLEAREQAPSLKELVEVGRKVDSSLTITLSNTQKVTVKNPSNVPASILSLRSNGILMSSGGRATSSNIGHVTFGDPSSSEGQVTFGSTSASQGTAGGQVTFRPLSSSSNLGSTGYLESSRGHGSLGGGQSRGTESESSRGLGSSKGQTSSAGPVSSTSKDSQNFT